MKLHENVLGNIFLSVGIGVFSFVSLVLVLAYKDDLDEIGNSLTLTAFNNPIATSLVLLGIAFVICRRIT